MPLKLGTTFTPQIISEFNLELLPALKTAIDLNLDYLRIGTYWNEIEKKPGIYDFSGLDKILKVCQKRSQKVVLTLGMKAPRWPEFYFPEWLEKKNPKDRETQLAVLDFIKAVLKFSKKFSCISHFQLENEALDSSGPDNSIVPLDFLKEELSLIKELDQRPVIISLWGNQLSGRHNLSKLTPLADIVGLDIYYQQFITKVLGKNVYKGPSDNDQKITDLLKQINKEVWIMELQAEPWESSREEYLSPSSVSISPEKIKEFFKRVKKLPVTAIFFWGFEYAYYQAKKYNNHLYLDLLSECIIKKYD